MLNGGSPWPTLKSLCVAVGNRDACDIERRQSHSDRRVVAHASKEEAMPDEPKPVAQRSYEMGNVGAGARVAQGENISWVEGVASLPGGESLTGQFDSLLKRIAEDASLDEDTRALAQEKT